MRSGGESPPKRPYTSAAFAEQRPLGNSTAAADASTQCVFEQLRRGRNSEHVHPRTPTCTERGPLQFLHLLWA